MRKCISSLVFLVLFSPFAAAFENPFAEHGRIRIAESGTHFEFEDGTPFFFLADTCWTGPALSTEEDWQRYLADRVSKGFTAIQFNMVSPWRTAPTDADGNISYELADGQLTLNEKFYARLDARLKAINDAGLLAVPVLCWAHKKGDSGKELSEAQIISLCKLQVARYQQAHVLWILAGDNSYRGDDVDRWKRIGRAVFGESPSTPVTTHPTGENFPWKDWENEKWLTVLGYQSGHGDSEKTLQWLHSGPVVEYGRSQSKSKRPILNLEPPYESHNGYSTKKPHTDYTVRRAIYWSLLATPVAGFTYGGHGVWSWHTKAGEEPTDHKGSGVALPWDKAIHLPGAGQVQHVRTLMNAVRWTTLRPEQAIIQQTDSDASKFAMSAKTDDGMFVVYFPAGSKSIVNLHVRGLKDSVRWFNPRDGKWEASHKSLQPPDPNDWVLVVRP